MKAKDAKLFTFLIESPQLIIPIYQRTYSWTVQQCRQLWDDIIRAGSTETVSTHFIGSVVYVELEQSTITSKSPVLVIDGQQRLTTIMLILEALARHLGDSNLVAGVSAQEIRTKYLLTKTESSQRDHKLLLSQTDKDSLLALFAQKRFPENGSILIKENFNFFDKQIGLFDGDFEFLWRGLEKLIIVDVALSQNQDNPQLIFESMNSTGKALSQADLIRNFVLMGLEPSHQTELYQDHWRPMEVEFGQENYDKFFDSFMRHYLTVKTGEIPRVDEVYDSFKNLAQRDESLAAGVNVLVADIRAFSEYFCAIALGKELNKQLAEAFTDLRELKVDVAYPFLLELYHDYSRDEISQNDFHSVIRLIEAYVFRRAACAIPTNSLNKTFATFHKALNKERYLESIKAHLLGLRSYHRFPTDEEFKRELVIRDLYNFRNRSYWLRRFENFERKERVLLSDYTIEHIMPQNEKLSDKWKKELGTEWVRLHETWLHTLGNLTLTGYNSEYSDRPFAEKRDMQGGFKQSPLVLNEGLGFVEQWNEEAIKSRAEKLANHAVKVWSIPVLTEAVLQNYQTSVAKQGGYSLEDHSQLLAGTPMRQLFELLSQEVLALDPSVTQDVLKLYVAFKAETNFVDVVPQKNRLRLSLNMPFHDLNDPKELARDVTNLGRWGNGDVEIGLSDAADLPYVMGLIRQALERQMGE